MRGAGSCGRSGPIKVRRPAQCTHRVIQPGPGRDAAAAAAGHRHDASVAAAAVAHDGRPWLTSPCSRRPARLSGRYKARCGREKRPPARLPGRPRSESARAGCAGCGPGTTRLSGRGAGGQAGAAHVAHTRRQPQPRRAPAGRPALLPGTGSGPAQSDAGGLGRARQGETGRDPSPHETPRQRSRCGEAPTAPQTDPRSCRRPA